MLGFQFTAILPAHTSQILAATFQKRETEVYTSSLSTEGILTQVIVVVGMSGGVDSSVTALLLAKQVCQIQHHPNHNECQSLGL